MHIIQINASYKPAYIYGGPTHSVSMLCEQMATLLEKPATLEVLTTTANGATELPVDMGKQMLVDGVPVTYFKRTTKDHSHLSVKLLKGLKNAIKANRQPIVHIHAWWNLVSVLSCWVAKHYNIPVALSPRGMVTAYTFNNRNSFSKAIIHKILGNSLLEYCHVHVTTKKEKDDVLEAFIPKSITVISNLVTFPEVATSLPPEEESFKLLFLSRIEEKKGLEFLFEALAKLNFNWQLTIAGSGENSYLDILKQKAVNLGIEKNITWVGQVANKDKFKLLAGHNLLCLTSYNENFANVVIESLSQGTPVLLSEGVGLADYVLEKQLGWICKLETASIINALQQAFEDKKMRTTIRSTAPAIIKHDFEPQHLATRYIKLYKSILNNE